MVMILWWRDVVRESTFRGLHTVKVVDGLRLGVVLFIISEVMFFVSFFWAFLHSSLAPVLEIGGVWPPKGLVVLNPFGVPLLNTLILLTSGATVTYTHYCLIVQKYSEGVIGFISTLFLAIVFTGLQVFEYIEAPFNLSDGVYASTFFLATGFHGIHVIVGTIFLGVAFVRFCSYHFTPRHHLGFEAAAWYWHFVDVVWLFLFLIVYIWGSL
jgi:cytochrome c oxidase subunit 3